MRAVTEADIDGIQHLHQLSFPPAEVWRRESFASVLAEPTNFGLLLPQQGFILGRVVVDEAEVLTLAVDPACRQQGYGLQLLNGLITASREKGAQRLFLEVAENNIAAQKLYLKAGFKKNGYRANYYGNNIAALLLERYL